jgi:hypothetical protein
VSHETIYRSLSVQARGALKKELIGHLRSKRCIHRSRQAPEESSLRRWWSGNRASSLSSTPRLLFRSPMPDAKNYPKVPPQHLPANSAYFVTIIPCKCLILRLFIDDSRLCLFNTRLASAR